MIKQITVIKLIKSLPDFIITMCRHFYEMSVIKYFSLKKIIFGSNSKPIVLQVYFDLRLLRVAVRSKLFL